MGIKGLNSILVEEAPLSIKKNEIKAFHGRKVAIDASMTLYQFLIAVRQQGGEQLTTEDGETTSHLVGLFYRTLRLVENGLKPMYVFDGKPPVLKKYELDKRSQRREESEAKLKDAVELEDIVKHEKRLVKVSPEITEESQKLLKLMGIPYIIAPSEAEAQCAELAKKGKVYAAASEDMDTLCYRTPYLLRHLTYSAARKEPIQEINTETVLKSLDLTQQQFIDLGIMLGCDYCESIKGVGPVTALKLIKEHGSLEKIIEFINDETRNTKKWSVPEDWPYEEVRQLFLNPDVIDGDEIELKWEKPDEKGIIEFLVNEKKFNQERVEAGIRRLQKSLKTGVQGRLDGFFQVVPKTKEEMAKATARAKAKASSNKKKGKVFKRRS